MRFPRRGALVAPLLCVVLVFSSLPALAVQPANPHFERTWSRTDQPVAGGVASRTWMWGPAAFAEVQQEPYLQSPGEMRVVQYFDKSRMELTNPQGDPDSVWYVTNGLLVQEMVQGQVQVGNYEFEDAEPANVNVAGDAGDPDGPTYATFSTLLDAEPAALQSAITERVSRDGEITHDRSLGVDVTAAFIDDVTNHAIAEPFWLFMNSSGTVHQDGGLASAPLFENPFFATGRPITEAYWATVQLAGTPTDILLQCFERRCLTYTPGNPQGWQVEAGNVGRHYYEWRYGPIPTPTTGDIRPVDIFYDPPDDGDRSGEHVTIQSFDPYPVDMTGWKLHDEGSAIVYTFPAFTLQPGATVQVYNCTGTDSGATLYTGRCTAWWNNGGDTAHLYDASGRLVSSWGY